MCVAEDEVGKGKDHKATNKQKSTAMKSRAKRVEDGQNEADVNNRPVIMKMWIENRGRGKRYRS